MMGFSGGTMERPALQRLLADIGEGLIDVMVVYKVEPGEHLQHPGSIRTCIGTNNPDIFAFDLGARGIRELRRTNEQHQHRKSGPHWYSGA